MTMNERKRTLCPVCADPRREEIAGALSRGESAIEAARRYRLPAAALLRHARHHAASPAEGGPEADVWIALREARETGTRARAGFFPKLLQTGVKALQVQADREMKALPLRRSTVAREADHLSRAEWSRILATLYHALEPYEEASAAVVAALEKMERTD